MPERNIVPTLRDLSRCVIPPRATDVVQRKEARWNSAGWGTIFDPIPELFACVHRGAEYPRMSAWRTSSKIKFVPVDGDKRARCKIFIRDNVDGV